jgi:DNA-binding response OmpR family regulator
MTGTARIVLVEDDPAVAELVALYLRNAGFAITHAPTAAKARELFAEVRPALVILDLGLPDTDGTDMFKEIRSRSDLPVVALTARAEEKLAGLEAGMDDFITKPFDPRELVARVRGILRRSTGAPGTGRVLRLGDVRVDPARHEVSVSERSVHLRAKEFELLEAFMRQPGIVLSRDKLLEQVWGFAFPGETRTVDVHVKQLRDKLEGATARIETVWGVGYRIVGPEPGP